MSGFLASLSGFVHWGIDVFHLLVAWLVDAVGAMGYPGVVALMFLESSFFPFPSEVVMPPAGYLASRGEMNIMAVILCGVAGSILGALFNYWIAIKWGRKFFDRFGKYFFVSGETLDKAEVFFERHGHISTFTCRLLPVIRQYVSLPAGIARMNLPKFVLYTGIGSAIWVTILSLLGYWIGYEMDNIKGILQKISISLAAFCALLVGGYLFYNMVKKRRAGNRTIS